MEWKKQHEFNSFNSWKGLLYAEWYKGVKAGKFLPPVEASLDPIHACNLMCEHCNAHRYLAEKDSLMNRMPKAHLMSLIQFLGKWGVKAICFGGGGEPTLHPNLAEALWLTRECNMEASIATNGTMLDDKLIEAIAHCCRWAGISVDAATPETYAKGRKKPLFDKVLRNIGYLTSYARENKTRCDVSYKFLIFDYNQHEIFEACTIAFDLGVKDFHARPADFSHQGMGELKRNSKYDLDLIKGEFEACHKFTEKLGGDNFRVFTVMHKYDDNFMPRRDFSQCYAAPLCIQLCADGYVYLCPDTRHVNSYRLGSHYPDPTEILKFWGGERHKELVYKTGRNGCTSRCTFSPYNRQCEALFMKDEDPFCWRFI